MIRKPWLSLGKECLGSAAGTCMTSTQMALINSGPQFRTLKSSCSLSPIASWLFPLSHCGNNLSATKLCNYALHMSWLSRSCLFYLLGRKLKSHLAHIIAFFADVQCTSDSPRVLSVPTGPTLACSILLPGSSCTHSGDE